MFHLRALNANICSSTGLESRGTLGGLKRMAHDTLAKMKLYRRDMGNLLFHFTRRPDAPVKIGSATLSNGPASVLWKIAVDGFLLGGDGYIKGGHKCVCFMETPISEVASIFHLARETAGLKMRPRYEPYGVAVTKDWLFERGGRPVIYQSESEYGSLPEPLRWRHVRYEPHNGIDFTWEREWRIHTDKLVLTPEQVLFVLPTAKEAFEFVYEQGSEVTDWAVDFNEIGDPVSADPITTFQKAKWLAVSLDFFGVSV